MRRGTAPTVANSVPPLSFSFAAFFAGAAIGAVIFSKPFAFKARCAVSSLTTMTRSLPVASMNTMSRLSIASPTAARRLFGWSLKAMHGWSSSWWPCGRVPLPIMRFAGSPVTTCAPASRAALSKS